MDVFDKISRSQIMSRVRSHSNTATEIRLMNLFRNNRIAGWRRKYRLFGKPDFVFAKSRLAVFVDGCFWHGCPKHGTVPETNRAFWQSKLTRNKRRDRVVSNALKVRGWRVMRIWQHELTRYNEKRCVSRIRRALARRQGLPSSLYIFSRGDSEEKPGGD
jgi:DNA mismatch endonuclease, patch repair protein